jgi:hypothetical protein
VTPTFSVELEHWLRSDRPKTFGTLSEAFGEKGFAMTVFVLMSVPALPLPTGGVTHVLEAVAVLVGLQMALGRSTLWLPRRVRDRELGPVIAGRAIPFTVRRLRWFERHSRRRMAAAFAHPSLQRAIGVVLVGLAVAAALAPPFSGLDTLPALGAVLVATGAIVEDMLVLAAGIVVGLGGVLLIVSVGAALVHLVGELL